MFRELRVGTKRPSGERGDGDRERMFIPWGHYSTRTRNCRAMWLPLRTFSSWDTETLCSLNTNSPSSLLQPSLTTFLLSVSIILTTLDISHEWIHTVFVLSANAFFICVLHCSQVQHPPICNIFSYTDIQEERKRGGRDGSKCSHSWILGRDIERVGKNTIDILIPSLPPSMCPLCWALLLWMERGSPKKHRRQSG